MGVDCSHGLPLAIIDSSCTSGTSTLEAYNSNFIARQLYARKCLKYRKMQCWPPGELPSTLFTYRQVYK